MKKILFINNSWNLHRTKSSLFLVEFLTQKGFCVDIMPTFKFKDKKLKLRKRINFLSKKTKIYNSEYKQTQDFIINSKNYDCIIFFQEICDLEIIKKLSCKNIVFVPMYDWYPFFSFKPFKAMLSAGIKILNFSKALQNRTLDILEVLEYTQHTGGGGGKSLKTLVYSIFSKTAKFYHSTAK